MNARKRVVVLMLALGAAVLLLAVPTARADLFAQYNFENDTTSMLDDTAGYPGYDHNMTVKGTQTGLSFDSSDKKVGSKSAVFGGGTSGPYGQFSWQQGETDDPLYTTSLTVSMWLKADSTGGAYMMPISWCGGDSPNPSNVPWNVQISGSPKSILFINYDKWPTTTLPMDTWVHVGLVHSGNVSTIYIDNLAPVSATTNYLWPSPSAPAAVKNFLNNLGSIPFDLGNRMDQQYRYKGKMDDVGLWNEALSTAKMRSLYYVANSALNYDVKSMDQLFKVYDAKSGSTMIGGLTWYYVPSGITSGEGELGLLPGGNYAINFGGGEGVSTIPEPSTLVLVAGGLLGLLCYAWRRRK